MLQAAKRVFPSEFTLWDVHDEDTLLGTYLEADFSIKDLDDLYINFYNDLGNIKFVLFDVAYTQIIMQSQPDIRMLYRKAFKHRDQRLAAYS